MLTVVCWRWKPAPGYRSKFSAETVNILSRMVDRHYKRPHDFVCVTDDPKGIDASAVRIIPLWDDHATLPSPHGHGNPSCYRRLKAFSAEAEKWFGPRFVSLDLDCVIVNDMSPVWDREDDFVIWGDTSPSTPYNGSMWMMTAGARRQVWDTFDPIKSPKIALAKGYFGSDQAWIGACLGPDEKRWTKADGVYSFRNDIKPRNRGALPSDARIVMLHGQWDPWHPEVWGRYPWVRQHYN